MYWGIKEMSLKLFIKPKRIDLRNSAIVGGRHYSDIYIYILGYYEAAKRLADSALNEGFQDALFYPMCFNYRHYLELSLKNLIINCENYYSMLEKWGEVKNILKKTVKNRLTKTHSLAVLLSWFKERFDLVSDETFDKNIYKIIIDFHNFDPIGQCFRYPSKTDGSVSFSIENIYDIKNIKDKMEKVSNYLNAVDTWITENEMNANSIF